MEADGGFAGRVVGSNVQRWSLSTRLDAVGDPTPVMQVGAQLGNDWVKGEDYDALARQLEDEQIEHNRTIAKCGELFQRIEQLERQQRSKP